MKTNRVITLLLFLLGWGAFSANAQEGATALDKVVEQFKASKDISATFSMTLRNAVEEPTNKQTGTIMLSGNKFHWNTNEMEVWYDGKSQWTYVKGIEEVNLTEPTAAEIASINPYSLVIHYKELFNAKALPSSNRQEAMVELTPKQKGSNIDRIIITLDRTTWTPTRFQLCASDRTSVEIAISKYTPGQNFPAKTFVFDAKQYPQAELIDLR